MEELPIWEKRPEKKQPWPPHDGRFVNHGQYQHQEVSDDPINSHGFKKMLKRGNIKGASSQGVSQKG
jgi:hypothetical protein